MTHRLHRNCNRVRKLPPPLEKFLLPVTSPFQTRSSVVYPFICHSTWVSPTVVMKSLPGRYFLQRSRNMRPEWRTKPTRRSISGRWGGSGIYTTCRTCLLMYFSSTHLPPDTDSLTSKRERRVQMAFE